ncbi:NAD(P)-dependent oxidoreductase [Shewanella sp. D64]|uniref:NAD-dependent epimerase/dehydratase family protein n=1 Tax=unclassified Shewanella TaxID=196818 RepID=UPI0022BA4324|nr:MULTISPECIES: NAD(P)-dependent oxidoreductase [unclassified Shewanella]MEC4727728.1 NAD(P)-dependent oxidoreductase [Shewanella sp. D64]MEC4737491.1 NAD(P)-dependent oxidoreductase [Shewanella sp. E94]WBJ97302.1 NAD(P)-dependent oxidoreductase [Shewanella sp. MTB7]
MSVDIEDLNLIANELAMDFLFFKNKKIFLTGGTGFFGKWLLETFLYLNDYHNLNISVRILSRSPDKFKRLHSHISGHENFAFIKGDIKNFQDSTESYDLIIHAATDASSGRNESENEKMRSTIIDGTRRICEFASQVNCQRILYTSSGAAYGPQPENMSHIPETFVDNPRFIDKDVYASAKLESEKYLKANSPCEVVIARCFAFSGPYLPLEGSYAFGNFIDDVLNGNDISIKGDGTAVRSYLYAADLVVWLLRILSSGKAFEIYNVGSSEQVSIGELAMLIDAVAGGKSLVETPSLVKQTVHQYVPDIRKAQNELGLCVYTSLSSSINKTLRFYK